MKNPLILSHYVIYHTVENPSHPDKPRMQKFLYETLDELRRAIARRCYKRRITLDDFLADKEYLLIRVYMRYDLVTKKVIRCYDQVSKRALVSNSI